MLKSTPTKLNTNMDINDEWEEFFNQSINEFDEPITDDNIQQSPELQNVNIQPEPTPLYVSTKSKMAYLNTPIDLNIFWCIPIIPYSTPKTGVIKKQIKINSKTPEQLEEVNHKLQRELYYEENIITHINNIGNNKLSDMEVEEPVIVKKKYSKKKISARVKFNDIRKITIGVSSKTIMSYRRKAKQAFYNCFVLILRVNMDNVFKECHVKVFNTGKLKIPGVQNDEMFHIVLKTIIEILQPYTPIPLEYKDKFDIVLTNSNFNCGFYILREELNNILRNKYNIQTIYDPCNSYPGILCKFYYNLDTNEQTGIQPNQVFDSILEVSFMIFRTGSVLIVGMCEENILNIIYQFLIKLFKTEFNNIYHKMNTKISNKQQLISNQKIRKRFISLSVNNDKNSLDLNLKKNDDILENDLDQQQQSVIIKPKNRNKKCIM